jgi:hypothetical protein
MVWVKLDAVFLFLQLLLASVREDLYEADQTGKLDEILNG